MLGYGQRKGEALLRVLLALSATLTTFAVVWLAQDWFNAILNKLPLTLGQPAGVAALLITLAALPFILLFNLLVLPGALVVFVLDPVCGCGIAVAAPVLIALAVLCGLAGGGLRFYRSSR